MSAISNCPITPGDFNTVFRPTQFRHFEGTSNLEAVGRDEDDAWCNLTFLMQIWGRFQQNEVLTEEDIQQLIDDSLSEGVKIGKEQPNANYTDLFPLINTIKIENNKKSLENSFLPIFETLDNWCLQQKPDMRMIAALLQNGKEEPSQLIIIDKRAREPRYGHFNPKGPSGLATFDLFPTIEAFEEHYRQDSPLIGNTIGFDYLFVNQEPT